MRLKSQTEFPMPTSDDISDHDDESMDSVEIIEEAGALEES